MKKNVKKLLLLIAVVITTIVCFAFSASAATSGNYTYTVSGGKATITDVNTSISGDVTIPSTLGGYPVVKIGEDAFYLCSNIQNITIPDSITSISGGEFKYCATLKSITVSENNPNYANDENGILYTKDKTTLVQYPCGKTDTSYTIPGYVTAVESYAFSGCDNLQSITIPENVTSIGSYAFRWCENLVSITLPDGGVSIGTDAFLSTAYYNNSSNWVNKVLYIDKYLVRAQEDISGVYTVKAGTKYIADYAFENCESLYGITIPDSVVSMGYAPFYYCTGLLDAKIGNGATTIDSNTFSNCTNLESVTIGVNVTTIGSSAFYNCYNLRDITIPDSVTSIGAFAFYSCSRLRSITLGSGVTSIGGSAFGSCTRLRSIAIPVSVTSIGYGAFASCWRLANVYYAGTASQWKNVEIISGSNEYLTGATIHYNSTGNAADKVVEEGACGDDVIYRLYADGNLVISGTGPMTAYNSESSPFYENSSIDTVVVEKGVTSIGNYAFAWCSAIESITIADSVTSIGAGAFYRCTGLKSVTIPDGVTAINSSTFNDCWELANLTIPVSVTTIYATAFYCCNKLTDVYYGGSSAQWNTAYVSSSVLVYGIKYSQTTIHYNSLDVNDINPGETKNITVTAGSITLLKFKPKETGLYTFYSSGSNNTYGYLYDANENQIIYNDDDGYDRNFKVTYELQAGTTYYWGARYYNTSTAGSFNVTLIGSNDINPGETKNISVVAGSTAYLTFYPEETGLYTFCSSGSADTYGYLYDADKNEIAYNDNGGDGNNFKITYELQGGRTYYWGAKYYSTSSSGSFNVTLIRNDDINPGETKNITVSADDITYLRFKPEETGHYTFCSNGSDDTYGYLYDADKKRITYDDNGGDGNNFKITYELQAGTTYYWGARYCDSSIGGSFSVTLIGTNAINPGETKNINVEAGSITYLMFNPEETGRYTFYSSGNADTYGYLCDAYKKQLACNDDGGENRNFKITYDFQAGTTYYLGSRYYSSSNSGSFNVSLVRENDINVDETKNISVSAGQITYLKFEPEKTGIYTFYSSSSTDTYGYLYNTYKNKITYDDDSGENNNFRISYELQAGITYYWGAKYYSTSNSGSFDVTLEFRCCHKNIMSLVAVTPTCTASGLTAGKQCSDCGEFTVVQEIVPATGHDYKGIVTKQPTCVVNGEKTYVCQNDVSHTYKEKINSLGHNEVPHEAKAPTCTAIGWNAYVTCSRCDYTTYSKIAAKGHDYEEKVTAPTCISKGYTTYTCECGDTYVDDYIDMLKHEYTSEITTPATHLTEGEKTFTCECGDTYTEAVEKLAEHTYEFVVTAPTCTSKGYTTYICECGDSYTDNEKAALGHKYTNACDTTCNTCSAKRTISHSYKAATCTAPKTCKVCKATTGKANGHKYSNACDTKCNTCSAKRSISHSYKTTITKATLTKNGKLTTKCTVCGAVKSTSTIYYPKTIKLSATSYVYNGKKKTPSVTVKDSKGKTLKKDTDYTVKYSSGRKSTGKYTVTITFKGKYSGTKKLYFTIVPKAVTLSKVTAGSKSATPAWKTVTGASGYQVMYSTSSKFKSAKTATVSGKSSKKTTIKSLKKGKKYYFKVRAYKTVDGKKIYGAWSTVKSVKVK